MPEDKREAMKNQSRLTALVPLAAAAILALAGCNSGLSAPVPVVSPQAKFASTVDAAVLPTDAPAPTSADNAPAPTDSATQLPTVPPTLREPAKRSVIFDALKKFTDAKSYRVDLSMNGKGYLGLSGDDTQPDPETLLFDLKGDFTGTDGHFSMKGFLTTLLGVAADTGFEAITLGNKAWVKGPIALLGADESKWYALEADQTEAVTPPFLASDFLIDLGNSSADLSTLKKSSSENLDGKKCDIYNLDIAEAKKVLSALNPGALPGVEDLSAVQNASISLALCDDGYIHRVQMTVISANKNNAKQTTELNMSMHVYDFNAAIKVTPPASSIPLKPLDMPTENAATPTP